MKAQQQEWKDGFLAQMKETPNNAPTPLAGQAEVDAIKAELHANPDVDETTAASGYYPANIRKTKSRP